jgi:hypothetical protein
MIYLLGTLTGTIIGLLIGIFFGDDDEPQAHEIDEFHKFQETLRKGKV